MEAIKRANLEQHREVLKTLGERPAAIKDFNKKVKLLAKMVEELGAAQDVQVKGLVHALYVASLWISILTGCTIAITVICDGNLSLNYKNNVMA
jgi:hypothetical protein